ncbi:MAG: phage holin [Aerococcus sp.]|nr:phage holin [Aerococcus sp.]
MSNKMYDFMKWFVWLFIPALTTVVGQTLGWSNTDVIITLMTAVTTFLEAITGLSNTQYNGK